MAFDMAIKIDGAKEILAKLEKEGKTKVMDDDPEYRKEMFEMEKRMEEFRRQEKIKSHNAWIAASKIVFTA